MADAEQLLKRFKELESARLPWVSLWRELAEYYLPRRAGAFGPGATPGQAGDEKIFDSTPVWCLSRLAANLGSLMTNPNQPWFGVRCKDKRLRDDDRVKTWLAEAVEVLERLFQDENAGFQTAAHEMYLDYALFGVGLFYVEADPRTVVRFHARSLGEVYLAESLRGEVEIMYRRFEVTVRQAVEAWGKACSQTVQDRLKDAPEDKVAVLHAVYPREDRDPHGLGSADFPLASVFLEEAEKHVLEESGFLEQPFMAPRWAKGAGETYGRGPGLTALPDVRVLNAMARTALLAGEKMADPPLMVPDDDFLGPIQSGPGGLSYYRSGSTDRIVAMPVAVDLAASEAMLERRRQSIRTIFLVDEFDTAQAPSKTAYQVAIENGRKMDAFSPTYGRCQGEFLGPVIRRVLRIAMRAGALPPLPGGLGPDDIEAHYTAPAARMQRQEVARAVAQTLELLGGLIGQGDPFGVLDNFDKDRIARDVAEASGMPPDFLRDEDEVDQEREARAEQAQGQAALGEVGQLAELAKRAGEADQALGAGRNNGR